MVSVIINDSLEVCGLLFAATGVSNVAEVLLTISIKSGQRYYIRQLACLHYFLMAYTVYRIKQIKNLYFIMFLLILVMFNSTVQLCFGKINLKILEMIMIYASHTVFKKYIK